MKKIRSHRPRLETRGAARGKRQPSSSYSSRATLRRRCRLSLSLECVDSSLAPHGVVGFILVHHLDRLFDGAIAQTLFEGGIAQRPASTRPSLGRRDLSRAVSLPPSSSSFLTSELLCKKKNSSVIFLSKCFHALLNFFTLFILWGISNELTPPGDNAGENDKKIAFFFLLRVFSTRDGTSGDAEVVFWTRQRGRGRRRRVCIFASSARLRPAEIRRLFLLFSPLIMCLVPVCIRRERALMARALETCTRDLCLYPGAFAS